MSRPNVRTTLMNLDYAAAIHGFFDSASHAFQLLELYNALSYADFVRALRFEPVRPEQAAAINAAWEEWRDALIQPSYHGLIRFTLSDIRKRNAELGAERFAAKLQAEHLPDDHAA